MFDHLICDCDGVLVDSEVIADRVIVAALTARFPGIDFETAARAAYGQRTSVFLAELEQRFSIVIPEGFAAEVERDIEAAFAHARAPIAGVARALANTPLPAAVVSNQCPTRIAAPLSRATSRGAGIRARRTSRCSRCRRANGSSASSRA